VGILDKTFTAPDRFALVPIEDARELWLRRDPLLVQAFGAGSLRRGDLKHWARRVGWRDGEDPDALRPPHTGHRERSQRHHHPAS